MTQDLLQLISNEMKGFSKGQKRIGAFILEHYDKAAFMTAAKLGETVGVSESTVVRFAAELGFEGYPQLQKSLQDIIRNRLTTVQRMEIIDEQLSGGVDVLHRVMSSDADKIRRTQEEIDPKDFDTVIDSIIGAHRIYILGLRSSGVLAGFLSFYFNHIFEDVVNVGAAQGETFEQMLRIGPNDVLIAISFPRYTKRVVTALEDMHRRGVPIALISDKGLSPVHPFADIVFHCATDSSAFLPCYTGCLALIDVICQAVCMEHRSEITEYVRDLEKRLLAQGVWM